jgi:hypothetical protein
VSIPPCSLFYIEQPLKRCININNINSKEEEEIILNNHLMTSPRCQQKHCGCGEQKKNKILVHYTNVKETYVKLGARIWMNHHSQQIVI